MFETAQLARRPAPGALNAIEPPEHLRGPSGQTDLAAAVRKVAGATIRGPLPRTNDPIRLLSDAAVRLRLSHKRPALDEPLAGQAAWLVLDRVGHAPTDTAPIASAMPDLVADPGDTPTPGTRLQPDPAEADAGKPRRKGWWSLKK